MVVTVAAAMVVVVTVVAVMAVATPEAVTVVDTGAAVAMVVDTSGVVTQADVILPASNMALLISVRATSVETTGLRASTSSGSKSSQAQRVRQPARLEDHFAGFGGAGWGGWGGGGGGWGGWVGPVFWPFLLGDVLSCAFWPNAYCYPFWSYGTAFAYDYGPYAPAYGYGGTGNILRLHESKQICPSC